MGLRSEIANIVDEILPLDDVERSHQSFIKNWIASGAAIFRIQKPANPETHLVSYFVPFDEAERKICLIHHKKANLWIPPGGHVNVNEHPKDTVSREMQEELFQKASFYHESPLFLTVTQTVNDCSPHTDVSLWYVVRGNSKEKYAFDDQEFYDISWFKVGEPSQNIVEPNLKRFIKKLEHFSDTKMAYSRFSFI